MNDFSSIDKLVEFGLGIAVAQQMIKTVNHSIDNMRVAGVNNRVEGQIAKFYAVVDGQQYGPFDNSELETLVASERVTPDTLMWTQGFSSWKLAKEISSVNRLFLLKPPKL